MNDATIRKSFHRKKLRRHHGSANTLVVDELGLHHGSQRADIAVINGHLIGYEIKSDEDTLNRLESQIPAYRSIFDKITMVTGEKHLNGVRAAVPVEWGIIVAHVGMRGAVHFDTVRPAHMNPDIDLLSVAKLLWKPEVASILVALGEPKNLCRAPRAVLYERLVEIVDAAELRTMVRNRLKNRKNWRGQPQPSRRGDSCLPLPN